MTVSLLIYVYALIACLCVHQSRGLLQFIVCVHKNCYKYCQMCMNFSVQISLDRISLIKSSFQAWFCKLSDFYQAGCSVAYVEELLGIMSDFDQILCAFPRLLQCLGVQRWESLSTWKHVVYDGFLQDGLECLLWLAYTLFSEMAMLTGNTSYVVDCWLCKCLFAQDEDSFCVLPALSISLPA